MQGFREVVEATDDEDKDQVRVKIEGYDAAMYSAGRAVIQVCSLDTYEEGVSAYFTVEDSKKLRKALKRAEKYLES